jgi:xylulokinase
VDPAQVQTIGFSSTNALVLLDAQGRVIRPAIMQLDRRAAPQAERLAKTCGDYLLATRGARPQAGTHWLPMLAWLRDNDPETWARIAAVLYPSGWVAQRLTGVRAVDISRATTTLLLDQRTRRWGERAGHALGLPIECLPAIQDATHVTGHLVREAADTLGVAPGVPVTVGAMDSVAAAIGVGAVEPGATVVALGTTARVMRVTESFRPVETLLTCPFPGSRYQLSMGVVWDAGTALARAASTWTGQPDYARLDRCLSVGQTSAADETARIVVDDIVAALSQCAGAIGAATGNPIERIVVTGGASRMSAFVDRIAAALDARYAVTGPSDAETRGAALLAAVAAGVYPDVPTAVAHALPLSGQEHLHSPP